MFVQTGPAFIPGADLKVALDNHWCIEKIMTDMYLIR
jgi:hypothetical protein